MTLVEKIKNLEGHRDMTATEIAEAIGANRQVVANALWLHKIPYRRKYTPRTTVDELTWMIGKKYNMLTVEKIIAPQKIQCRCDCGKTAIVSRQHLKNRQVKSCGCYMESIGISQKGKSRLNAITKQDIETLSNKEICEKYGLSTTAVSLWCKKNKIELNRAPHPKTKKITPQKTTRKGLSTPPKFTPEDIATLTQSEAAEKYGISRQAVSSWAQRHGVKFKKKGK